MLNSVSAFWQIKPDNFIQSLDEWFRLIKDQVSTRFNIPNTQIVVPSGRLQEKEWFDFQRNELITPEKILRSCFSNPDRAKYGNLQDYEIVRIVSGPNLD